MNSVSKKLYIDKLDDIVNKYNNTYHDTIKMKPVDVKSNTYIDSSNEINDKNSNLKLVIMFEYQNLKTFLQEAMFQIGVFVTKKIKNTVPWTYVINDLNGEEIAGTFSENELQKTNQKEFRIEKVIKRQGYELYVKWKGYDNSFNSWIDKKDIV